ncbi:ABC transporter permease [Micromonospora sp. LOL_023]|uniref:ABC transporter permease n=1 Tax=Micromonospora sp. LOL_023 TaxID=3345418 RepID=UPI003A85AE03
MAYDDSPYRRRNADSTDPAGHDHTGDTWSADPDLARGAGYGATSGYQTSSFTTAAGFTAGNAPEEDAGLRASSRHGGRRRAAAGLDDVFDDPWHGERGRDRLGVHLTWEFFLLIAVGGLGYLLYLADPDVTAASNLDPLLAYATGLGLLVLAAGVTLRAGAPNLAIGPVAIAAALHFAENGDDGVLSVLITVAIWAVVLGAGTGLLVTGLQVPGWAGSLIAACVAIVFIQQRPAPVDLQGAYDPTGQAVYLFGGFAVLAVLGAIFGTVKAIRRGVGRSRPVGDPAERRGGLAAVITSGATIVSMVFAAVGGVLLAALGDGPVTPSVGMEWTALAVGAALLGGTSAFGRRGGVFGTLFVVVGLTVFIRWSDLRDFDIALYATAAVTLALGLVVTRLVEAFGRPHAARTGPVDDVRDDDEQQWEEPEPEPEPAQDTWTPAATSQESWSATLPAQPAQNRDRWDTGDRWE